MRSPAPTIHRRDFLKWAAIGAAAPLILPRAAAGANSRIRLAWIGAGGMGSGHLHSLPLDQVELVAIADVDSNAPSREIRERFPHAKIYTDFRHMFNEMGDRIDAVGIATPDHVHFAAAYLALLLGKHLFIEKPMAHSVWEVRTLRDLAAARGVKTQMGNQGHATEGIRLVKEWYEAGLIGDVREVITWTNRPTAGFGFRTADHRTYPAAEPVPSTLDWDQWLGPVTQAIGYHPTYHPAFWRGWWAFGCGGLGDIGCHTLDTPFWAMNLGSPTRVDVAIPGEPNPLYTVNGSVVSYHFEVPGGKPPVKVTWHEGPSLPTFPQGFDLPQNPADFHSEGGMVMIGEKGIIAHPDMRPNSPRLYPDSLWEEFRQTPSLRPERTLPRVRGGIMSDFLSAIRDGHTPTSDFSYAAPLTEMVLLGSLAIRTGQAIEFDSAAMRIPNNPAAHALLQVEARPGWDVASLQKGV
jgi:predicted dehydrogenase